MYWIFLPAYNEAESLPHLLPRIDAAFSEWERPYHVVVLDDGSNDETPELLQAYTKEYPLTVLTHSFNRGLGETERDGFEYLAGVCEPDDIIVRLDCDDTHHPEYIFKMAERLEQGCDVVNTSRFQPGGGQQGLDLYRTLVSRAANLFMAVLYRIPGTRDYSCGFRAYRARVIQDALSIYGNSFIQLKGLGFTSTLEMLVKLHMMGCRFGEVPFVLRYDLKRSGSKMLTSVTTLGYLIMTILYLWPFDGWKAQFRGLGKLYRQNPEQAVAEYQLHLNRLQALQLRT